MSERLPTPRLIGMMGGFWLWAAQFTIIYAVTALACARGFGGAEALGINLVRLVIVLVTLACLAGAGAIFVSSFPLRAGLGERASSGDKLLRALTMSIAALSAVAILYNGLPALIVPVCTS